MLWNHPERVLHEGMRDPTPDVVRSALKHFGIARSFKGIASDETGLLYIADTVRDITNEDNLTPNDAQKTVVDLALRFKEKYPRSSISAASKLLWLKHRTPFLIYDRRAMVALGFDRKPTYAEYYAEWRRNYEGLQSAIVAASNRLCEIKGFLSSWLQPPVNLSALIDEDWFHERAFDVYLWETGGDGQQIVGRERRGRVSHHDWSGDA